MAIDLHRLANDRSYCPCRKVVKGIAYWACPAKYRAAGYRVTSVRLRGSDDDKASQARDLTRAMLQWYAGETTPRLTPGSWKYVILRYTSDEFSPMHDLSPNTRDSYLHEFRYWEAAIGHMPVSDATYAEIKTWQKAMAAKGRTPAFIHRKFSHLRILASYAKLIDIKGAAEVRGLLSDIRFKTAQRRTVAPTEAQVMAIIAKAEAAGAAGFALGILIQYRTAMRAMDVRGGWFRIGKGEERSGICRGQFRWGKGLTWDMISPDVNRLRKVASKTAGSSGIALDLDLTLIPDVRAKLLAIPSEKRVGPLILDPAGMPYRSERWGRLWSQFRAEAKVPEHIWMMDTRAAAISDARRKGAAPLDIRDAAAHADLNTTMGYMRESGANNVLRIRLANGPETTMIQPDTTGEMEGN